MRRHRCPLALLLSLALSLALVVSACGVPEQTTPQLVPTVAAPEPGSPLQPSRERTVQLYFVRDGALVTRPQLVTVPARPTPAELAQKAVDLLVKGPTPVERQNGVRSPIAQLASARSTIVVSLVLEGTVRVDLGSGVLQDMSAVDQILAFAQIVYTLTNLSGVGIGRVQFLADARSTSVLTGQGIRSGEVFQGLFACAERGDCDVSNLVELDVTTSTSRSATTSPGTATTTPQAGSRP